MPTHSNHRWEDIVLVQKRLQFSEAASAELLVRSLIISLEGEEEYFEIPSKAWLWIIEKSQFFGQSNR